MRDICSLRPNKSDGIVDCACFVIRDLKKERSDGLSDSCKVGVGRLSIDRLEVVKGMQEFCQNLFGSHSTLEMAPCRRLRSLKKEYINNHLYRRAPWVFWVRWLFYGCCVGGS